MSELSAKEDSPLDSEIIGELYKDLLKNSIAVPLEACKSMATGCVTVASLYGAVLAFVNYGHPPKPTDAKIYVLLVPFAFLAISGFIFARAYLPHPTLPELLFPPSRESAEAQKPGARLIQREASLRSGIVRGSWFFWLGLAWAVVAVAFVRFH